MENKQFYTVREAAEMLGKSRIAIFKKIQKKQIGAKKVGRRYLIAARELEKLVAATLSKKENILIQRAVGKAVSEYGKTFKLLGAE